MTAQSERAGNTLRAFGELGWFKFPLPIHPQYGYRQLPYIGWRYKNPTNEIKEIFKRAAEEAPEHLEWIFDPFRKNWLLAPGRLSQDNLRASGMTLDEMIDSIIDTDQEYCRLASIDIDLIVDFLENLRPIE